jgi:hypothetical protein
MDFFVVLPFNIIYYYIPYSIDQQKSSSSFSCESRKQQQPLRSRTIENYNKREGGLTTIDLLEKKT